MAVEEITPAQSFWIWFGGKVLPGLLTFGVSVSVSLLVWIVSSVNDIKVAVVETQSYRERIEWLEKNTVDVQTIERIIVGLDNAELEGHANFATKAVSRLLKNEVKLKKESRHATVFNK